MSRLIVKSLPKNITQEKLRGLFGQKGTITDIQLKYTKDGVFRQFAFVGFQTDEQAESARKYFNNSFIQTSRIKVETCAPLGSQEKPKSWSKYSKDSTAFAKQHGVQEAENAEKEDDDKKKKKKTKKDPVAEIIGDRKDDPNFVEFMEVHTKNRNIWGNDAALAIDDPAEKVKKKKDKTKKSKVEDHSVSDHINDKEHEEGGEGKDESKENVRMAEKDISDMDYMKSIMQKSTKNAKKASDETKKTDVDLFTIKIHDIPYKTKRQDILKFFKPLKPFSVRLPTKVHGFCYVGFKTEKDFKKGMLRHKSFIKGKQVFFSDFTEKNKITKNKGTVDLKAVHSKELPKNSKWIRQEEAIKNEENISESGCIFFRNLAYTINEDDIQKLFENYGPLADVSLPIDSITRQIKGFGTVTFVMPEHAVKAFTELDGTLFHGRLLHLIPGKSKDKPDDDANEGNLGFKAKKEMKLKQSAGQSHNWNTLFLGANAVADILAKRFETTKETILDSDKGGSSAAVRLALGETELVMEMKKFLEENDVQLDAFDTAQTKRSKTVLLAKNLPAETTVAELKPLFSKYGLLARIVLPPSGITALIEFLDPSEAKQAFKKLAYSKFKYLPLYLEWAPENAFKTKIDVSNAAVAMPTEISKKEPAAKMKEKIKEENEKEAPLIANAAIENDIEEIDDSPEPETTLFLRNLNYNTRENAIREHFKRLGSIHTIEVAMRKDPEDPKNKISLGYGFIQFKKKHTTEKALKTMQFTQIEGNQVELKRSDRILKSQEQPNHRKLTAKTKQTGTKILVKNIPFQAKPNEVREIFKAFGEVKSVRLPKKMAPGEDSHRGFGFVDFVTESDAKKAFDTLSQSTHLYGRRLVLAWASVDDDNVEEIRKRTAQNFETHSRPNKAKKKALFDTSAMDTISYEDES